MSDTDQDWTEGGARRVYDPRDEKPRGPDRRQAPRRQEDAALHYARELLIAAALGLADGTDRPWPEHLDLLRDAARQYRRAEQAAHTG